MSGGLDGVETPVGIVDLGRAEANARRVVEYCDRHGLRWRPHIKTHKSTRIARMQLEAGARGLTVATPREAEVMATVCDDLLLAYPPVGASKIDRILSLPASVRLSVALDSVEALQPLARAAADRGREVDVLVELDAGLGRVGVAGPGEATELAAAVRDAGGVRYAGVLFYSGHLRAPGPERERGMARLGDFLNSVYEALAAEDLGPEVVSGGTSPTLWSSHRIPGLTEVRAGTCIYNDRDQVAAGSASPDDLAYSVLATVVSTSVEGRAAIDAGSKALSRESRAGDGTFGALLDRPEVRVVALSEEHGMLDLTATDWRPRVGDRVRVVPDHVCVSVNLQDRVVVLRDDEDPATWPLEARGRLRA